MTRYIVLVEVTTHELHFVEADSEDTARDEVDGHEADETETIGKEVISVTRDD